MTSDEYLDRWKETGPLQITLIEKTGTCRHEVGETFSYQTPYDRPPGVCFALLHVLDLYTWRVAQGFPSWEKEDSSVYRIHCPSKRGTVWELKKIGRQYSAISNFPEKSDG